MTLKWGQLRTWGQGEGNIPLARPSALASPDGRLGNIQGISWCERPAPKKFSIPTESQGDWPGSACDASQTPCSPGQCLPLKNYPVLGWHGLQTLNASGIAEMVKDGVPLERGHRVGDLCRCERPKTLVFGSGIGGWVVLLGQEMVCPTLMSSFVSYSAFWVPESLLKGLHFLLSYLVNFTIYIYFYYLITFIICIYVLF